MDTPPDSPLRASLEQWRAFVAVVEEGGYARAALRLNKSQSTVTYGVQKLADGLGVTLFAAEGRRSVLTPAGRMLYDRARLLLDDAGRLEHAAHRSSAGWEAEIALAVEVLFPTWLLLACLDRFGAESPHTHVELLETVLDGTEEAITSRRADLAVTPTIPPNFTGELLTTVRFLPVAHPEHPLHRLGRELTLRDLRRHRHIVVRDSGTRRDRSVDGKRVYTVETSERWTVTNMATSIGAVCRGYGFAWLPTDKIRAELEAGDVKPLPLKGGHDRRVPLYLVFGDADSAGPGVRRLAAVIRESVQAECAGKDGRGS